MLQSPVSTGGGFSGVDPQPSAKGTWRRAKKGTWRARKGRRGMRRIAKSIFKALPELSSPTLHEGHLRNY